MKVPQEPVAPPKKNAFAEHGEGFVKAIDGVRAVLFPPDEMKVTYRPPRVMQIVKDEDGTRWLTTPYKEQG